MQIIEEYLDVVDENDNVIGCETRSVVHRCGLLHWGIYLFLFDPEGQLLCQRRRRSCETWPSALDCSVSEHVRSGENYQAAAMRGLREELGITTKNLRPVIKFKLNYGETDNMISQLYIGSVELEMVQMILSEIEEIYFLDPGHLLQMIDQGDDTFSRWFKQLILWYSRRLSDLDIFTHFKEHNPH